MTKEDLSTILRLIDEWVDSLQNNQLNEQCRVSGADFFSFMKSRGSNAAMLAKIITEATGYNPATLWRVQDADLLKEAIRNYESSVKAVEYGHSLEKTMKHFWRKRDGRH